jgi:hypothetical protein
MTRGEALKLTRKLYRDLAVTGSDVKPGWALKFVNRCPLCQYVYDLTGRHPGNLYTIHICVEHCPAVWPKNEENHRVCHQNGGLWARWRNADGDIRKKLATQISELPRKRIKK